MPLFVSDEELSRLGNDNASLADRADAFIRDLSNELATVRAQADMASITAEQTCSLIEHKYLSLLADFSNLQSSLLQSIGKDGEIERLTTEISELHKSKRQLLELVEQKDSEISEKNASIKTYLDKIVNLSNRTAQREAHLSVTEAELLRTKAACTRFSQEKELIERHNAWLNDELTAKADSLIQLRRTHADLEADMSSKLADVERQFNECSSSLQLNKDRVRELEMKITALQEELCSTKSDAAANEEQCSAELSTVNKLVELYKDSSEEWSKKAGELEGVIKALEETYLKQVENEASMRKQFEKEAADLKLKLEKCEAGIETSQKANEPNLLPLSNFTTQTSMNSFETTDVVLDDHMLVPEIPVGVSGTALATLLLRDGWSLAKMYAKYQEAVDALRHEQLGRKESEAVLERVFYKVEEKAKMILDERAEHERMVEAYSMINQKLQNSKSEQANLEKTILELKAELRRNERDYTLAQKEIVDLQKQVTVLLKECRDIQIRCGSAVHDSLHDATIVAFGMNADLDAERVISVHLLTFKDINGLVEQNAQLRSLVRNLSDQIESRESEFKEKLEMELEKHTDEAASRVTEVLQRAEGQGRRINALEGERTNLMLRLEGSQEASIKAKEQVAERVKCLEEELTKFRSEVMLLRSERDKLGLEANFARERLESFMKEFELQRNETNGVLARNVEFSQLIVDYQRKLRESSESLHAAEEVSRKLTMEVSVLKNEKEMLVHAEKRAYEEVRSLSERVYHLQASLDTIQSAEQIREEERASERKKKEEYVKQVERELAEAKKELREERDNVRRLNLDREQTIKNSMKQVEQMGRDIANALRAVTAAETRAAVAEAKLSDLEKKMKSSDIKDVVIDGGNTTFLANEVAEEDIEKLKEEAKAFKDHMLQYKSIAQVNEEALKQMESAHENFKTEAEKLKRSLEDQLLSLKERISELENEFSLKSEEVASAAAGKEEALSSALGEITSLKDEKSANMSKIVAMEIQISALKEDLEMEHQRWCAAQANYERQVILQSETIQELNKTSQVSASVQEEVSELRKLADTYRSENNELKAKWNFEKAKLEESKNNAEKKYNELNEQNKILHSRLEAIHIRLAEKVWSSSGLSTGSTDPHSPGDAGLQNVINYLRRSKEIAETEISLLKQEKLCLQSQLECALKAAEAAQSSLHSDHASSRLLLFSEDELKSLRLQVTEMNLLRESNIYLREENKHNFEECQKLDEIAQKANVEIENLERLLKEREIEQEACKKEIEMQKLVKEHLEKRVSEILERSRIIDVENYDRLKDEGQQLQEKVKEKDAQIEEIKKLLFEKQEMVSKLEQDLSNCRIKLTEMEKRTNESLQIEGTYFLGTILDDLANTCVSAVENYKKGAQSVFCELGAHVVHADATDTSLAATSGSVAPAQAPTAVSLPASATSLPPKSSEHSERIYNLLKNRKKLVLPHLVKPDEPPLNTVMTEMEGPNNVVKPTTQSNDTETQGNISFLAQPLLRKRRASSSGNDVVAPVLKKAKGGKGINNTKGGKGINNIEGQSAAILENVETLPGTEETGGVGDLPQVSNEETLVDAEKEEVETSGEKGTSQVDSQNEENISEENLDRTDGKELMSDDGAHDHIEPDNQQSVMEIGSEREEGELELDAADIEGSGGGTTGSPELGEGQPEPDATPAASPARIDDDDDLACVGVDVGEFNAPSEVLNDEKNHEVDVTEETAEGSAKSNDGNDQIAAEIDQPAEAASTLVRKVDT